MDKVTFQIPEATYYEFPTDIQDDIWFATTFADRWEEGGVMFFKVSLWDATRIIAAIDAHPECQLMIRGEEGRT